MIKWKWGKPLIDGFSNKPQKGFSELRPDAGIPFRRLRFSDIQDLATCNFILDRTDYIRFMSWYKYELRQGTLPFQIFDCRYGIERTARLIDDVPQYDPNSNYYNLSLAIAFESSVETFDWFLVVNENDPLIVNNNDNLLAGVELRL